MSQRAAAFAVIVAFAVGLLASLALRPAGSARTGEAAARLDRGGAELRLRWRLPVAFPTSAAVIGEVPVWLSERLAAASGGALRLDVYEPGELVPVFSLTDAVRDRKVEAGHVWLGYDQGKIPSSVLFAATPFGLEPWEYLGWWFEGGGRELADDIYARQGIKPVLCGIIGPETAGWFREPLRSLEDLEGLKIRFSGIGGKVLERVGASITILPGGEIFQALEKGAIDATEFSMPVVDQALGFDRVASHNYFPGWHQTFTASHLVVNLDAWNELAPADQALIELACDAVSTQSLGIGEARQGAVLKAFPERGVTAHYLERPMLDELRRITQEVLEEEAARDADFRRVYASQQAFREVYRYWKEMGYLPRDY